MFARNITCQIYNIALQVTVKKGAINRRIRITFTNVILGIRFNINNKTLQLQNNLHPIY